MLIKGSIRSNNKLYFQFFLKKCFFGWYCVMCRPVFEICFTRFGGEGWNIILPLVKLWNVANKSTRTFPEHLEGSRLRLKGFSLFRRFLSKLDVDCRCYKDLRLHHNAWSWFLERSFHFMHDSCSIADVLCNLYEIFRWAECGIWFLEFQSWQVKQPLELYRLIR